MRGFLIAIALLASCATNSTDRARQSVSAAYLVYASARSSLDSYDSTKQSQIEGQLSAARTLAEAQAVKVTFTAYKTKHDEAAAAIESFRASIAVVDSSIQVAVANNKGIDSAIDAELSNLYKLALQIKNTLEAMGVTL